MKSMGKARKIKKEGSCVTQAALPRVRPYRSLRPMAHGSPAIGSGLARRDAGN